MVYFASNTYLMKRDILSFSNIISRKLPKPEKKFIADMNYGILASGSCLLTGIVDQLHEPARKTNIVDRFSRHLAKGTPKDALKAYLTQVKQRCPDQPVIHIDDSDVMKPEGYKFESLGWVRDSSESTSTKNVHKKGYHLTKATVLTKSHHPVSIFSKLHSLKENSFTSINDVTFSAMERAAALFEKATFVMDRGYDDNKMFLKLDSMGQDYVIRLTAKRKLLYHNKWVFAAELCNRRKGKVKLLADHVYLQIHPPSSSGLLMIPIPLNTRSSRLTSSPSSPTSARTGIYKDFIPYIEERYGKKILPINRRSECDIF